MRAWPLGYPSPVISSLVTSSSVVRTVEAATRAMQNRCTLIELDLIEVGA